MVHVGMMFFCMQHACYMHNIMSRAPSESVCAEIAKEVLLSVDDVVRSFAYHQRKPEARCS